MGERRERSITLPAPRNAPAILFVVPWLAVSAFFVSAWIRDSTEAGAIIIATALLLPGAYLIYETLYGVFGFEVLTVSDTHLVSERRLFGRTTRRRRFKLAAIEDIAVEELTWYEWTFAGNWSMGFDEGLVSFWCDGRWCRVGEGLRKDEEQSQALAELLTEWVHGVRPAQASS